MNKENAKDYLPLVQALADRKDLEWHDNDGKWHPVDEVGFGYEAARYRIKQEPREFWVVETMGILFCRETVEELDACARRVGMTFPAPIKVREVCS